MKKKITKEVKPKTINEIAAEKLKSWQKYTICDEKGENEKVLQLTEQEAVVLSINALMTEIKTLCEDMVATERRIVKQQSELKQWCKEYNDTIFNEQERQRLWIEAFIDPILRDYRNNNGESVLELFKSNRYNINGTTNVSN